jgi:urease accessory protein UreF
VNAQTDQQLLRDYAGNHSEAAFAELVRRHVDLVYSAALRMVCDSHQAEDVTQSVFVALAQNAPQLTHHPVLSGWLHRTTQNLAANAVRTNVRRQTREQEALAMNELLSAEPDTNWEHIAPRWDDMYAGWGRGNELSVDAKGNWTTKKGVPWKKTITYHFYSGNAFDSLGGIPTVRPFGL